jgi:para-nitrobenzyl esterase
MQSLVAPTTYGPVRGQQEDAVHVWRGIPYAQAPTGARRFRAPEPPQPWLDVREALTFGPIAPQLSVGLEGRFNVRPGTFSLPAQSEDCLTLNVWAPLAPAPTLRPVLVWVHGGSFITGSGSTPLYDGARFAAHGEVLVVTFNYRLGPLGFLHLASLVPGCADNVGLLDQVAALRWVRENIQAFGGDPHRVTVFGESAGAMSIASLLGRPAAQGLFQAAILQSGAVQVQSAERAQRVVEALLRELALEDPAALLTLPLATLLHGAQQLVRSFPGGLPFQPVQEEGSPTPLDTVGAGAMRGVPLLLGTNHDEGNLFVPAEATGEHLLRQLEALVGPERAVALAPYYPASRAGQAALLTDTVFWVPALQLAERQVPHAPVWMYRFDWQTPSGQPIAGAFHGLELGFVWDTLDTPAAQLFLAGAPAPQSLSTAMHQAWLQFAHHHDTTGSESLPATGWPRYTLAERATLLFNSHSHVEEDPYGEKRQAWLGQ